MKDVQDFQIEWRVLLAVTISGLTYYLVTDYVAVIAVVAGPAILLLDEITANLDAKTEQNVLMALKKVSKDRTVISISHRMTASMGRTIFIS